MTRPPQTPLVRIHWPGRNEILVKNESACPTGTFKDRLAWRLADLLSDAGPDRRILITTITLGNTLVSLATAFAERFQACHRPQLLGIFPQGFSVRIIGPDNSGRTMHGSDLFEWLNKRGARYVEHPLGDGYITPEDAREIAIASGLDFDTHRDVTNGIGVPAYEVILDESLQQAACVPDWILVPVGAGVLFDELVQLIEQRRLPTRVLGVTTVNASSIADKIYGKYSPYFSALECNGEAQHAQHPRHRVITVDDETIRDAVCRLPEDLHAEPSAAAAFVPLSLPSEIAPTSTVLVVNTGDGILPQPPPTKAS